MRACVALLVIVLGACKDAAPPDKQPTSHSSPADAAVVATDWTRCEAALREAPKIPPTRRVEHVIDGCRPCGDWAPLLRWDTLEVDGGPSRVQIEQAMLACNGYCNPNAKQRFLGTLDAARSKGSRGPWRHLGDLCGAAVSAVPDARYMSAPFFALDRIGRAAAARPELAALLDALELPLPAISSTGSGISLPASPVTAPNAGPVVLTVSMTEIRAAALPHAKLGKAGVTIVAAGEPYPGALVKDAKELAAVLQPLGHTRDRALAIFAPSGMAASRLVDVLRVAASEPVVLAAAAEGAPIGWSLAGTIPVALTADKPRASDAVVLTLGSDPSPLIKEAKSRAPAIGTAKIVIELGPEATVAGLAKLVGALVYFDVKSVALVVPAHPPARVPRTGSKP